MSSKVGVRNDEKIIIEPLPINEVDECKGLFFRASTCVYRSDSTGNDRFVQKMELRLLKKRSCPGCGRCGIVLDELKEFAAHGSIDLTDIKHGRIYTPKVTNISRDWETGIIDDWDIEFVEVKDEV